MSSQQASPGAQLVLNSRTVHKLAVPRNGDVTVLKFGRNHAFAGEYPYQQVGVVSGTHFVVQLKEDLSATITDTSSNGTYLNKVRLKRNKATKLNNGDLITLIGPTSRVGAFEVRILTPPTTLTAEELALVRRYATLLSEEPSVQVQRERQQIDKKLQTQCQYALGDYDPKKKDESEELSSGSLGAADGHNATLHFKAPIHAVMAKQHNKIRPGVKSKELPDVTVPGISDGGTKVSTKVDEIRQYCLQQLNLASVRAFNEIGADAVKLKQLHTLVVLLDAAEQSVLDLDPPQTTRAASPAKPTLSDDIGERLRELGAALMELDSSCSLGEHFDELVKLA